MTPITRIATLGPIGRLPTAPGTWGSAFTIAIAAPLVLMGAGKALILLSIVAVLIGVWVCDRAAKDLGDKDPKSVVFDELAGQLIVLCVAPASVIGLLLAFGLFRLFDILKPPPVSTVENLKGGLGIMADDVVAGLLGAAVLWGLVRLVPGL